MLRLHSLGGCYLERDGVRLETASAFRKGLALLALVAAGGERGLSRDRAVALLWPDSDDERARNALRQLIHTLRGQLDAPELLLPSAELRLNPAAISSDVADFRAAVQSDDPEGAAGVYAGPFLDGFYLKGADEFERWAAGERASLASAAATVLQTLAERAEHRGDLATAIATWRRLCESDPLSARAATGLMRVLDASGDRTAALKHARVYQLLVHEELGETVDPSVAKLVESLRSAPAAAPSPPRLPEQPPERSAAADVPSAPSAKHRRRRVRLALPFVAVLLIALAGLAIATWSGAADASSPSVVVLPLANTSGDPRDDAISDGLTENLIAALATVPGVRVIGRTSAFAFKDRRMDLRVIADTLGVSTVLDGSVQRAGDRLKVTAQLVNAADGTILWSDRYDRELRDMLAVQDEIARAIVGALSARLGGSITPRAPRTLRNAQAYELYLRGRQIFVSRTDRSAIDQAQRYFEQALQMDSSLAPAWAGLSDVHARRVVFGYEPPARGYERAKEAARRALALDSTLAEAYTSLAHALCVSEFNQRDAERLFAKAVALSPGYGFGRTVYAVCLIQWRRFDAAKEQLEAAQRLDPLSPSSSNMFGRLYMTWRRPDEAIRHLQQALELSPQMDLAWQVLGHAYLQKGMRAEAIAAMRRAAELSGARDSLHLAYAYAVTGDSAQARRIVDQVLASPGHPALAYHLALAYTGLRDHDRAFSWLERGIDDRGSFMSGARADPALEPLRRDARWSDVERRLVGR